MRWRIILDKFITLISTMFFLFGIFILFWILKDVIVNGLKSINLSFFLEDPRPPGIEGGGLRNAIIGSFLITSISILIAFPIGILSATYISEYSKSSKFSNFVRFVCDVMASAPSIVIGAYVYALFVNPFNTFSAISGSFALSIIMIPIILKTLDELFRLVPNFTKEAAYALGAQKWKVITSIIWQYVRVGILTSVLLSFSRIIGETAPLLFTSFNNMFFEINLFKPMATLTVNIFNFAMSPYENWHKLAWSASFLIVIFVLIVNLTSRLLLKEH